MHIKQSIAFILVFFLFVSFVPSTEGAEQGQGEAVVGNAQPSLVSREILDGIGGTNQSDTINLADNYQIFNVTVSDTNTMADIKNLTIWIYSTDGVIGTFAKNESYGFQLYNNSGTKTWYELTASGWVSSETYIENSTSYEPSMTVSQGEWAFNVTLDKVANNYGSNQWRFNATVWDSQDQKSSKDDAVWFDVQYYSEFTVEGATVQWTGLNPADINVTATTPTGGNNSITVVAINHDSDIRVKGDGDLVRTGGGGTPYPLNNCYVGQTDSAGNNDGVTLTTSYQTFYTAIPKASENLVKDQYEFMSVPNPCVDGSYTFTWYVEIAST